MNVESNDFIFENPYQEPDIIYVTSEHPTYDFQIGNLVAMVSGDQDPFWLAHITKVDEDSLEVVYFHHGPFRSGKSWFGSLTTPMGLVENMMFTLDLKGKSNFLQKEKQS
jgi:hypothetical protein